LPVSPAMSSRKPTTTAIEPTTTIPLSPDFCTDDADVVIRAAGSLDFRAHKLILSFVSPIFKDMFTLPQPPPATPDSLPHVDVQDSPDVWQNILRTIYPILSNPKIDTLDDLESLLLAAQAYEMQFVIETHKGALKHREFIEKDPLRLYAIACMCGFEDQATYVARNAELLTVTSHLNPSDLKGLTLGAYSRLVSFLAKRDNKWYETLEEVSVPWCDGYCSSASDSEKNRSFYNNIKKHLRRPYVQTEEVYLKALEKRPRMESSCREDKCSIGHLKIKEFIQRRIEERDKICDRFQPTKWYCERLPRVVNPSIDINFD
jgi:hypothetical protein